MQPYTVTEGAHVSRRTREAVHGLNQEITDDDTIWPETVAGQRAKAAKGATLLVAMVIAWLFCGLPLFYATYDVGVAFIVPVIGVGLINGISLLFTDESATGFAASIVFGVAAAPKKYVRKAIRKGTVVPYNKRMSTYVGA